MEWPEVAKRSWHSNRNLTEFLNEMRGSANQISRGIMFPAEGTVSTEVWGSGYMEGPGASPMCGWSGLCEGTGRKDITEARWVTARTLHFIQGVMGSWALFYWQSRCWRSWSKRVTEWYDVSCCFRSVVFQFEGQEEISHRDIILQSEIKGHSGWSGDGSPEPQQRPPSLAFPRDPLGPSELGISGVAGPGVWNAYELQTLEAGQELEASAITQRREAGILGWGKGSRNGAELMKQIWSILLTPLS